MFGSLFSGARTRTTDDKTTSAPTEAEPARRAVEIGWVLDTEQAHFIWEAPRRVRTFERNPNHAKALNNCPAHLDYESRLFEIPCPIDARLKIRIDDKHGAGLTNLDGDQASVRFQHLTRMLALVPRNEWRHPDRPLLQLLTPYVFVADERVWLNQLPPVQYYNPQPWPGLVIGGRLPIHIWPRMMMWAFEWWDPTRELVLERGEPWFYVHFETADPRRPIRLVEAEMTPDLQGHIKGLSGVTNYVDQTYALFKVAEERRPPRLLQPKARGAGSGE